ncbi:MAG: RagB/SusD family nutrient uptake outer membrane protein [Bacteroidota bacterium]
MKTIKNAIFFILTVTSLLSCKENFLNEVNDNSTLIRQDYVVNIKTTNEFLNGIYTIIGQNLGSIGTIYPEVAADNLKPAGTNPLVSLYNWQQQSDESSSSPIRVQTLNVNEISYSCYGIIRSCNFVIEKAEQYKSQDAALASSILGQAYGIRAYMHLFALNYFAQQYNFSADGSQPGIPYIVGSNWTEKVEKRNTVKEVYQMAIEDLKRSVAFKITQVKPVYFNNIAALALLSRAYLNIGEYQTAISFAREVIILKPLMVTGSYPDGLFKGNDTETIFEAPPGQAINGFNPTFASYYFRSFISFQATSDIADLLLEDANDKRKVWVKSSPTGGWDVVKFPVNVRPGLDFESNSYYLPLIRSSEMHLIAAECYANLNRADSSQFFIDQVRKRANPTAQTTTLTGLALLNIIYKERRKEFAFEGFRLFDVLRWKKDVVRQDAVPGSPLKLTYPSDKAIAPIPGLDVKSLGLEQNKAY